MSDVAAREVLRSVFGFEAFREGQAEVVDQLVRGGDALVLMPTGGGKSLCYQVPSIVRPGVGVVVSPLIALMKNQVDALLQLGVRAAYLNSSLSFEEAARVESRLVRGELDLLYVAPERLMMERMLDLLERSQVALFAIDEAHCVSQWGHDFRPEYLQLSVLEQRFAEVPRVALTATADEVTRGEIVERLGLTSAVQYVHGFDRPNIRYRVMEKENAKRQLLGFLRAEHAEDAGIVYCLSRRRVEQTAEWLSDEGFRAIPYHAGLDRSVRARNQELFLREEGVIVVATIAFGMGIDKPDVRFVAHLDLPKSVEAYYQETGRAGRDGQPSNAWMTYGLQDVVQLRRMVDQSDAPDRQKWVERSKLDALLGYCEITTCRRRALLAYFGDPRSEEMESCGNCDTCLEPVETWDATVAAQKALSCVYRTGQRFGVAYLTDVLVGKPSERMQRFGHDRLPTFGVGADLDPRTWRSVFRQLTAGGFLTADVQGHGSLLLTSAARPVLRGEQELHLRKDRKRASTPRTRRSRAKVEVDRSSDLFEALRRHRKEVADEQGVPPYVVFHDATLGEMDTEKPTTLEQLSRIHGVGAAKLERYGDGFLGVIREHLDSR